MHLNEKRIQPLLPLENSVEDVLQSERSVPAERMENSEGDRKARRRALSAKWEREKRLRETPEERERRLERARISLHKARANETPEARRARLDRAYEKRDARWKVQGEDGVKARREYFRAHQNKRRNRDPEGCLAYKRQWHSKNRDAVNAKKKEYRKDPLVKVKESQYSADRRKKNPEKVRSAIKNWIANNRDHVRAYARKTHAQRYKTDPQYAVTHNLRSRMLSALKVASARKSEKTMALIGCTGAELVTHIERQFTEGMSWSNYGQWHVDHKKPCAAFNLLEPLQQQQCFHFSNLQPLWNTENWAKKDKWTEPSPDPSSE